MEYGDKLAVVSIREDPDELSINSVDSSTVKMAVDDPNVSKGA